MVSLSCDVGIDWHLDGLTHEEPPFIVAFRYAAQKYGCVLHPVASKQRLLKSKPVVAGDNYEGWFHFFARKRWRTNSRYPCILSTDGFQPARCQENLRQLRPRMFAVDSAA